MPRRMKLTDHERQLLERLRDRDIPVTEAARMPARALRALVAAGMVERIEPEYRITSAGRSRLKDWRGVCVERDRATRGAAARMLFDRHPTMNGFVFATELLTAAAARGPLTIEAITAIPHHGTMRVSAVRKLIENGYLTKGKDYVQITDLGLDFVQLRRTANGLRRGKRRVVPDAAALGILRENLKGTLTAAEIEAGNERVKNWPLTVTTQPGLTPLNGHEIREE